MGDSKVALVMGGAGFIGSYLVDELSNFGMFDRIVVADNMSMGNQLGQYSQDHPRIECHRVDCSDSIVLRQLIKTHQPTTIFHLAANSDIAKGAEDSRFDLKSTFATTAALGLVLAADEARPDVFFASTSAVYGAGHEIIKADTPKTPASSYGWTKLTSEVLLRACWQLGQMKSLTIMRFPNVTGARQTHGVVRDLVRKYFDTSRPWEILGDGYQTKPYVHARVLAKAIVSIMPSALIDEPLEVNYSPSDSVSVRQIVEVIEGLGGLGREPVYGTSSSGWEGDVPRYSYDTSHLSELGIEVPTSLQAVTDSIAEEIRAYV